MKRAQSAFQACKVKARLGFEVSGLRIEVRYQHERMGTIESLPLVPLEHTLATLP